MIQKIIDWITGATYETIDNTTYRNGKPFSVCGLNQCDHKHCIDFSSTKE